MNERLNRVREAIEEVFGEYIEGEDIKATIERSTFTGEDDPGGWAPTAHVVIHCEDGIPNGCYNSRIIDMWYEVSDKLGDMYVEHINGAIIGVYDA